jgi:hypothetical protein
LWHAELRGAARPRRERHASRKGSEIVSSNGKDARSHFAEAGPSPFRQVLRAPEHPGVHRPGPVGCAAVRVRTAGQEHVP